MRLSTVLFLPKAPFPGKGKSFETLFVSPQKQKKAWDGQDKDAFFRDKYAHVHAKQLRKRKEEQQLKRERLAKLGKLPSNTPESKAAAKAAPRPDFHQRLMARFQRTPKLEFIYGTNAVRAALKTRPGLRLHSGHTYEADIDPELVELCRQRQVPIVTSVPSQHLQIMSNQGVHNKLVLETEKRSLNRLKELRFDGKSLVLNEGDTTLSSRTLAVKKTRPPLGLYIDQVTDTHNMGALLRSALWFGVDFVAFSSRNSAPYSPAVVKASSGAAEFVSLWEVDKPLHFFDSLRSQEWAIVASAPSQAVLDAHDLPLANVPPSDLAQLNRPTLLVVGSEGDGIRTSLLQRSTHATSIATDQTEIDSLNVSVATAILLSQCA